MDLNRSLNSRENRWEMSLSLCEEFALAISTMKTSFFLIVAYSDFLKNCGKISTPQSSAKGSLYSPRVGQPSWGPAPGLCHLPKLKLPINPFPLLAAPALTVLLWDLTVWFVLFGFGAEILVSPLGIKPRPTTAVEAQSGQVPICVYFRNKWFN